MELDTRPVTPPPDLKECLEDEPAALAFFNSLLPGHRTYYIKWLETAKTEPTRIKRIAQMVNALSKKQGFPEMIRAGRKENS
jgi:uncharacterized protein YdeI (YjbR/CyaY-like superfamily)